MKVAGLSIEDGILKAALLSRTFGAPRMLATEELPLPKDNNEKSDMLASTLKTWKTAYGIKGVVVSLDFQHFSRHYIELPVSSPADIKNALRYELQKHLPFSPEEYAFDFITTTLKGAGSLNFVMSIKKDRLQWIIDAVSKAGLRLLGIRCSGIEVMKELIAQNPGQDMVYVYNGLSSIYLVGLKNGLPETITTAPDIQKAIPALASMKAAFDGTIYAAGFKDMSMLDKFDVRSLAYSVPELIAIQKPSDRSALDMDFIPEEFRPERFDPYPLSVGALCVLCVLLFFGTTLLAYYKDHSTLRDIESRITEIKTTASELMETKKELDTIAEKRQFLLNFQPKRNIHINVLKQISMILPKNAWLTRFTTDEKGKVSIQGFAKRSAKIIAPLEESPMFRNVEFSSPVTVRDGKERFAITMEREE